MEMHHIEAENYIENHEMVWRTECPQCEGVCEAPIKYGKYVCLECGYEFMALVTKWREIREEI